MRTSELRIGNLVFDDYSGIMIVTGIAEKELILKHTMKQALEGLHEIKYIKPIPLTEQWLLKFGFELDGDYYVNGTWLFEFYKDGFSDFLIDNTAVGVKYVHQLQNLYFALTGKELEIKELEIKELEIKELEIKELEIKEL